MVRVQVWAPRAYPAQSGTHTEQPHPCGSGDGQRVCHGAWSIRICETTQHNGHGVPFRRTRTRGNVARLTVQERDGMGQGQEAGGRNTAVAMTNNKQNIKLIAEDWHG